MVEYFAVQALQACLVSLALSLYILSDTRLGGYGWEGGLFTWNLHPTLLLLGIFGFMPYGMLGFRLEKNILLRMAELGPSSDAVSGYAHFKALDRARHGLVQGVGLACALGGYAAAYVLHELRGHAHLPALHKPLFKQAHIYGGLLALALLVWQAVKGIKLMLLSASRKDEIEGTAGRARGSHSLAGWRVWLALVVVCALGLFMPLVDKAGANKTAPVLFAVLMGSYGVSAALVSRALFDNSSA